MSDHETPDHAQTLHTALVDLIAEDDGPQIGFVIRTVVVAEVLLDGHDESALVHVSTGDVPNWTAIGMLRAACAEAEDQHVREDDQ